MVEPESSRLTSSKSMLFDEYTTCSGGVEFDAELTHNLDQLKCMLDFYTNKPSLSNQMTATKTNSTLSQEERLDTLSSTSRSSASSTTNSHPIIGGNKQASLVQFATQYKELVEFFTYYKNLKTTASSIMPGEIKFLQLLMLKRLNFIYTRLLGLNKRLASIDLISNHDQPSSLSLFQQFVNYEHFFELESQLNNFKKPSLKLIINSVNMEQFQPILNDEEFQIVIFQFEKSKSNRRAVDVEKTKKNGSKSKKKSNNNRSTSADHSSKFELGVETSSTDDESLSDLEDGCYMTNGRFSLNEKCLCLNTIEFNQSLSTNVHTSFDLRPSCGQVNIVLYKMVKVGEEETLRSAIKYECFDLVSNQDDEDDDEIKPVLVGSRLVESRNHSPRDVYQQQSGTIFRRMFKSKSSSRRACSSTNQTSRLRSSTTTFGQSHKLASSRQYLDEIDSESFISLSCSSANQITVFLNSSASSPHIDLFEYWRSMWRPSISSEKISGQYSVQHCLEMNNKIKCAEVVNIYFKSIVCQQKAGESGNYNKTVNHRSKLDQYQLAKRKLNTKSKTEELRSHSEESSLYFLRVKKSGQVIHVTNLFKINEPINDLFQFELSTVLYKSYLSVSFELVRLSNLTTSKIVATGQLNFNYSEFYSTQQRKPTVTMISSSSTIISPILKLRICKHDPILPPDPRGNQTMSYDFLAESSYSIKEETIDLERLESVVSQLKPVDLLLARKILILFSHLNTKNLVTSKLELQDKDLKRLAKNRVVLKLYDLFIRLISQLKEKRLNEQHFEYIYADLIGNSSIYGANIQPKQIVITLLNVLKELFDESSEAFGSPSYELTLECLDLIIKLMVDLTTKFNKSSTSALYELKYGLNDVLLIKLVKQLRQSDQIRVYLAYSKIDFKFLNHLYVNDEFFNGSELASMGIKLLTFDGLAIGADTLNDKLVKSITSLFNLDLFVQNYQFRDRLIEHLIAAYFQNPESTSSTASPTHLQAFSVKQSLSLIKTVLKSRTKLNKTNFETFLKNSLSFLIDSQIRSMKQYESLFSTGGHHSTSESEQDPPSSPTTHLELTQREYIHSLADTFLVIIDSLDYISNHVPVNNASHYLGNKLSLKSLFDTITFYFKHIESRIRHMFKLCTAVVNTVLKFAKYVQKFLLKNLINRQFNGSGGTNSTEDSDQIDSEIQAYFEILFTLVEQNNLQPHVYFIKTSYIQLAHSFWTDLSMRLKRSIRLSEFLVKNLLKCMIVNCYLRRDLFQLEIDEDKHSLPVFYSKSTILTFNRALFTHLNDLVKNSEQPDVFLNTLSLHLIEYVVKFEKYKRLMIKKMDFDEADNNSDEENLSNSLGLEATTTSNNMINLKCFSRLVYSFYLSECVTSPALVDRIRTAFEYNFLREFYDKEQLVSSVEKYLFLYELFKIVERMSVSKELSDSKRKIKIYLLDELYALNKQDKNYLQMSFIRKEQADLLEWDTLNPHESDLKEILYLKSLKKFAINSIQDKYLIVPDGAETTIKSSMITTYQPNNQSGDIFLNSIQYEICKELGSYYEKIDASMSKFSQMMNLETRFAGLMSSSADETARNQLGAGLPQNQHGHYYFRIGLFGRGLKMSTSLHNKYYLYRHKSHEMLSIIQQLILNKLIYSKWQPVDDINLTSNEQSYDDVAMINSSGEAKIVNKVTLLHHNQEPDESVKENTDKCYVQICAVNRLDKSKLCDLVDEMLELSEESDIYKKNYTDLKRIRELKSKLASEETPVHFYYFDRPFYSTGQNSRPSSKTFNPDDPDDVCSLGGHADDWMLLKEQQQQCESVENLWIERNVLMLDPLGNRYENITQFEDIISIQKVYLNPIRNAISDINEKTKELKHFVVEFTTSNLTANSMHNNNMFLNIMHNLQPLTMRLLGCLDARVNGGLIKYVVKLLDANFLSEKFSKKKKQLVHQLYLSIKDQLNVLESGLSIHDRILKDVEQNFRDTTSSSNNGGSSSSGTLLVNNTMSHGVLTQSSIFAGSGGGNSNNKNFSDHIKHMIELNRHLISCLKVIEDELNDRWSKFC